MPLTSKNLEKLQAQLPDYAMPDLMFEVASATASLDALRQKIQEFLMLGTVIGVLVDPRIRRVEVMRASQAMEILGDGDTLVLPKLLPGWELEIASIWAPVF